MTPNMEKFCKMIRCRTNENRAAMNLLFPHNQVVSPAFSIIRQEVDSMVKVIFLLSVSDLQERERLVRSTLIGEKWKTPTPNGRWRNITDKELVELSQKLHRWTLSVYKFGCAFIHLSDFHNHLSENPFEKLSEEEKQDILAHMRYYHNGPSNDNPSIKELASYFPRIFEKIASNLECYVSSLEKGKHLEAE
jgi:hypothetical protein